MIRRLPFLIGLLAILVSGIASGALTGRWRSSAELLASVDKLAQVPRQIGDWEGTDLTMDARELKAAGILGSVYRKYENKKLDTTVTLFLVSGPPGPISVHSPEVCYPGVGYQPVGTRSEIEIGRNKFWNLKLSKQSTLSKSNISILYAWNASGVWEAPTWDPRMNFAKYSVLYKMYIVQEVQGVGTGSSADAATDFVESLLPVLRGTLFDRPQA